MTMNTQKVVVDGITIETTDQGAQVIAKLQRQLGDAASNLETEKKQRKEEKDESDKTIAKKDAEIDDLKAKIMTGDALDSTVAARADLLARATAIAPSVQTKGLSDAAIRKAVVVAKFGDSMKDKPDAYIDARFDILAESAATTNDAQSTLRAGLASTVSVGDDAKIYSDAVAKHNAGLNAHRKQ